MKKKDELADFFKEKFESFEPQVPANAWNGIKAELNTPKANGGESSQVGVGLTAKIVTTLVSIGVLATLGLVLWSGNYDIMEQNTEIITAVSEVRPEKASINRQNKPAVDSDETVLPATNANASRLEENIQKEKTDIKSPQESPQLIEETPPAITPEVESTTNAIVQNKIVEQLAKEEVLEVEQYIPSIIADQNGANPNSFKFYGVEQLAQVKWQFGDGNESTDLSPIHSYDAPGEYVVTLLGITNSGQSVLDKTKVVVHTKDQEPVKSYTIKIPNVITPDGDGINDVLVIEQQNVLQATLNIYQVNGQLVYTSDDINKPWKGVNNNGEKLNKATYFYLIKIIDTNHQIHTERGYITIF